MLKQYLNEDPIKIIAISGSPGSGSSTTAALKYALQGAEIFGAEVKMIELSDCNLVIAGSVKESDYPEDVTKLRNELNKADGIILGTPEYHGSLSGILKNALDLLRKEQFENKVVGLVGVAGGELGATNSLNNLSVICRTLHCWVSPHQVSIANSGSVFDKHKKLLDKGIKKRLINLGHSTAKFTSLNRIQENLGIINNLEEVQYNRVVRSGINKLTLKKVV
jgi:NAD(P)H-dependent FMN reductase